MIEIPRLTPEQHEELQEIRAMLGWQHVIDPIKVAIQVKQSSLVNFTWNVEDGGEFNKKSIIEYKAIQTELMDLKQFLSYLEDNDIMEEAESTEVFDVPKQT